MTCGDWIVTASVLDDGLGWLYSGCSALVSCDLVEVALIV